MKGLTELRKLNLLGAAVTDEGLAQLRGLKKLEELNLYRTQITNAGLEPLKEMKNLTSLDLRYTRATRAGVDGLRAKLPGLRVAFLDSSVKRAAAPAKEGSVSDWVRSLGGKLVMDGSRIRGISLAATAVSDAQIARLASVQGLEQLNLETTEIGDVGARQLAKLTSLVEQIGRAHV